MLIVYNFAIRAYTFIIWIASLSNQKAKLWISGRKDLLKKTQSKLQPGETRVWFHFASLGEFEQGRPVLEKFKAANPEIKIVMTFFSPSGYEIRKDYPLADYIFYLPADTPKNAGKFIELIKPSLVFFTKYEYWYHYFNELHKRNIPLYIISAIFRKEQAFFRWYGNLYRTMLKKVNYFFIQDEHSANLLKSIGFNNYAITGDTRFDRVFELRTTAKKIVAAEKFSLNSHTIIAGSTWPEDEKIIGSYIQQYPNTFKWIIVPHEIDEDHLKKIESLLNVKHTRFSRATNDINSYQVLIVDSIGMLSSLYQYGFAAYIGGGFGKGIHNTLEAATFGIPVIFGPNYQKFKEARDLITSGAASSVNDEDELKKVLTSFINKPEAYKRSCEIAEEYVRSNAGATDKILSRI